MTEYQPESDLEVSRAKLQGIVDMHVLVEDQTLFESVLDVLVSRGTKRWNRVSDACLLSTATGISVIAGYGNFIGAPEYVYIHTEEGDEETNQFEVREEQEGGYLLYAGSKDDIVSNQAGPNLSAARLLQILADAHKHTPLNS